MMIRRYDWSEVEDHRTQVLNTVVHRLPAGMEHVNLFLLPKTSSASWADVPAGPLCEHLRNEFSVHFCEIPLHTPDRLGGPAECLCIAIDCSQPERVRDAIRERLWLARCETPCQATLEDILRDRHRTQARAFRLDDYGLFLPYRTRRFQPIRTHSFDHHPGYYRYRLALARTAGLPEPMADYLHALFTDCPNHLFRQTVFRASRVGRNGLRVRIPLTRLQDHDIIGLACGSHRHEPVSSRHENLQKFFLDGDPTTIACEVPVWMESWELADYREILRTRATLTGHIDVLRLEEDGLIGVWDYKPRAAAERDAHIQVFLYALMLALRTSLPLSAFTCGYFDEKDAYVFRPTETRLEDATATGRYPKP